MSNLEAHHLLDQIVIVSSQGNKAVTTKSIAYMLPFQNRTCLQRLDKDTIEEK